jgi:hypothetical protein
MSLAADIRLPEVHTTMARKAADAQHRANAWQACGC